MIPDKPGYLTALFSIVIPFAVTLFVLPRLAAIAQYVGLIDQPGGRKVHLTPKPLVGGLAMSLGVAFGCLLFLPLANLRGYYAGAILLVIIGFLDDYREVHHRMKFIAELAAALLVFYFCPMQLRTFGDLLSFGSIDFHSFSVLATVIGIVGATNAMNMIDGVDGLAGSVSLIAFITFGFLAWLDKHLHLMLLCLSLSGTLIAFIRYNWPPSKLFMGDAGSLFLGFSAAFMSIGLTQEYMSNVKPVVPLLVLTVPITDALTVMTRRIMKGRSPFYPDNTHMHHILLFYGFSPAKTVFIISSLTIFFSLIAVSATLHALPEHYLFGIFMFYFVSHFTATTLIINRRSSDPSQS